MLFRHLFLLTQRHVVFRSLDSRLVSCFDSRRAVCFERADDVSVLKWTKFGLLAEWQAEETSV
jgi:hypothetical protein